ncbi:MAG: hypothetical protein LBC56_02560 [Oscillospiraceae bacterium]|jgi:hypothetical protein|nr:hypothetical protein [Oscillospiraceae bacterium]
MGKVFKNKNIFFFAVFMIFWLTLIIWNILTPTKAFSENENRGLKQFPEYSWKRLVENEFAMDIDTFVNDQFIGRDGWISLQTGLDYLTGKREVNDVFICGDRLMADLPAPNSRQTGYIEANIQGIKDFAGKYSLPSYFMLVPGASEIQKELLPYTAQPWDQGAFIGMVNSAVAPFTEVIDVLSVLAAHKDEYIFYRTDHHWTSYGAFLAYREFCGAAGLPAKYQEEFSITAVSPDFWGTLDSKCGFRGKIQADTIEIYNTGSINKFTIFDGKENREFSSIYFDEYLSKKDKYSYIFGPLQPAITFETGSQSGKSLLIFKDSYAHSLAPMLARDYEKITLIDLRSLVVDLEELVSPADYDAVLYLYSTETFSQNLVTSKLG